MLSPSTDEDMLFLIMLKWITKIKTKIVDLYKKFWSGWEINNGAIVALANEIKVVIDTSK